MRWLEGTNLKLLILMLALFSMLVTVINMFYASARVHRQALVTNTLQHNAGYATKLAQGLQVTLLHAQQELTMASLALSSDWPNPQAAEAKILELYAQNTLFNSIYVADAQATIIATSDNQRNMQGQRLSGSIYNLALNQRSSWVSGAFVSAAGNLVTMLVEPIFDRNGDYAGYIAASFYLQHNNLLQQMIGQHYQQDGSYIYIIDSDKRLIYHMDNNRLGYVVENNPMLDSVISGQPGSQIVINSLGVEMLAGYDYIPVTGWGVVAQSPGAAVRQAHSSAMRKIMIESLPVSFLVLLAIWVFASLISRPLRLLASNARRLAMRKTIAGVQDVNAWFYEAQQLKRAMLLGLERVHDKVEQLQHDVDIDPLTGLNNRRVLEQLLQRWTDSNIKFCALMLDIDHFKDVNDKYGHAVGDEVLQQVAALVQNSSRSNDISVRMGGEEFLLLMSHCELATAVKIAERLRNSVEQAEFSGVGRITVSIGVAFCDHQKLSALQCIKAADDLLYQAKRSGRNLVCVDVCSTTICEDANQNKDQQ